jgi:hypothetical protein
VPGDTAASASPGDDPAARRRSRTPRPVPPSPGSPPRPPPPPAPAACAPSRAHGSSNSTRHLASSPWTERQAAPGSDLPDRPLKPVTARAVRHVERYCSSERRLRSSVLTELLLPEIVAIIF